MKTSRILSIAAAAGLVILGGVYVLNKNASSPCRSGAIAGGAIGGAFTLVDENGQTVTEKDVIDMPALLYFGYTFCPDVCPLDTTRNVEAVEILHKRGFDVKPVFISIDPERDTPEVMREFTDYLHPDMLGLTGSPEQVKAASQAYRTYFKKHEPEAGDEEFYLVDHSTFTYLVTPKEGFLDFFRRDLSPEQLADQVQCFLDNS